MNEKISMISLGCAKNRVDGEMLLFRLRQAGFEIISDIEKADGVIVNTCGFIDDAKKEAIDEIITLGKLKAEGIIKAIIVTGCLAERYRDDVIKELPEADAVVGIGSNGNIADIVRKVLLGKKVTSYGEKTNMPLDGGRIQSTPKYYSYLKVADGCDNRCAYCAIPLIRGPFRSRTMERIITEAKHLADSGVTELMIIAQDTTRYGEDLYGKLSLTKLLKELCKIEKIKWIRLLYCYPDRITDELLETIAQEDKILKYIDLPLQHASKSMLKAMNRKGDKESLLALIKKIRDKIPNVILRTTLITGFPGETEEDFTELCEFIEEARFERLGCFAYSREEDTPAFDMENQIDEEVKLHRRDIIMEQQNIIMERYNNSLIGTNTEVLIEGYDRKTNLYIGRTVADSPDVDGNIMFTSHEKLNAGSYVTVKVTDVIDGDPVGEYIKL